MDYIIGEYQYNIDQKGRVVIPPRFRDFLGQTFVITKGLDGCLFVFPEKEWQRFAEKVAKLPVASKQARTFSRFFFAGAAESVLDRQGRVMIPPALRKYAGLEKSVVVTGMTDRLEIWDEATWEKNMVMDPAEFADQMCDLGI